MANATAQTTATGNLSLGALWPSRNGSVVCPYVGIIGGELLEALPDAPVGCQWRLFTKASADGFVIYGAVTALNQGEDAPFMRVQLGTLIRTQSESSPYRIEISPELTEAAGEDFPSGLLTWREAGDGTPYLSVWMPRGGQQSVRISRMVPQAAYAAVSANTTSEEEEAFPF
jgi:hypothetical protein